MLRVREGYRCAPQGGLASAAAILAVAQQRYPPAGELDADLMGAACVELNPQQRQPLPRSQHPICQAGLPNATARPLDHKAFISRPVMEQEITADPFSLVRPS